MVLYSKKEEVLKMSEYPVFKRSNRIKELRQEKGLTLKELGKKVGLRDNTLSQYETGKRTPKDSTIEKIADFFNVSTSYLMGFSTERDTFGDEILRSIRRFDFEKSTPEETKKLIMDISYTLIDQINYLSHEIELINNPSSDYDPY